jgi:hypothetical protein
VIARIQHNFDICETAIGEESIEGMSPCTCFIRPKSDNTLSCLGKIDSAACGVHRSHLYLVLRYHFLAMKLICVRKVNERMAHLPNIGISTVVADQWEHADSNQYSRLMKGSGPE